MKLEEIESEWSQDAPLDTTNLSKSAADIPILHNKYYKLMVREKIALGKLKAAYDILKFEKYEFLLNPTKEGLDKGWEIPDKGKLLKNEVDRYLSADKELVDIGLKILVQQEKVDYLKEIVQSFKTRAYLIKDIIEDRKWLEGN